jgi:hypothetical protein
MFYTAIHINPFVKKMHKLPIRIWISSNRIYNDIPIGKKVNMEAKRKVKI